MMNLLVDFCLGRRYWNEYEEVTDSYIDSTT